MALEKVNARDKDNCDSLHDLLKLQISRSFVPTCPICMETYSESTCPKLLYCGHSFCKNCLKKYIDGSSFADGKYPSVIRCPICRHRISVTKGSVETLPNNFQLLDVVRSEATFRAKLQQLCMNLESSAS